MGTPLLPSEMAPPPAPKAAELVWVSRCQLQQAPGTCSQFSRSWMIPNLCPTARDVVGHRAQHEAALPALPLQDSSCLYILSFLLAAAVRHVNFAVMQGLLFPVSSSAMAAAGCPCQRVPISQGSCRGGPTTPSLPAGTQPGCPRGS